MGCGESKHAVATENTLTKSKSKTKSIPKTDEYVNPQVINNTEPQPDKGKEKEKENGDMLRKEISIDVPVQKEEKQGRNDHEEHGHGEVKKDTTAAAAVAVVEENKNENKVEEGMMKKEVQLSQEEQEKMVLHSSQNNILPPNVTVEGVSGKSESSNTSVEASQSEDKVEENDHVEAKETNSNEEKEDNTNKMDKSEEAVPGEADVAKSSVAVGEEKTPVETEKENVVAVAAATADEKAN